jgi:hypothetical protein
MEAKGREIMRLRVLRNILRKLRHRTTKGPESEGQKVLMTEQTIDSVLARQSGDVEELEEFLDSVLSERIEEIEALNETLRGKN